MSQYPQERPLSIPRRFSRASSPSSIQQQNDPGYRSADFPMTDQVFSRGAMMAADLERALAGLGGVVAKAGAIAEHEARLRKSLDDDARSQAEIIEQGQEAENARQDLAAFADGIANGAIKAPMTSDAAIDRADEFIDIKTDGYGEFRRAAYIKAARPTLDRMLHGSMADNRAKVRTDTLLHFQGALSIETTAAGMKAVMETLDKSGIDATETEKYAGVLDILRAAATRGPLGREQYQAALEVIGNRFPPERAQAEAAFRQAGNAHESEAIQGFNNTIAGMVLDNRSDDEIRERILQYRHRKIVPDNAIEHQVSILNDRARQAKTKLDKQVLADETGVMESAIVREYSTWMLAGDQSGGSQYLKRDLPQTFKTPSGQVVEFSVADNDRMIKAGVLNAMSQIDAMVAPGPLNDTAMVRLFANNTGVTNPRWETEMIGAFDRIGADTSGANVPERSVKTLDRFRMLGSYNIEVRDRHTPPADREGLRVALFMVDQMKVTPGYAMTSIVSVRGKSVMSESNAAFLPEQYIKKLRRATDGYANGEDVFDEARTAARAAAIYMKMPPKDAVEYAIGRISQDYMKIGDNAVYKVGRPFLAGVDADAVADTVIGAFRAKNPAWDDKDLSFGLDAGGRWTIKDGHFPVGAPALSDENFNDLDKYLKAHDTEKAIAERRTEQGRQQEIAGRLTTKLIRAGGKVGPHQKIGAYLIEKGYSLFIDPMEPVKPVKPGTPARPEDNNTAMIQFYDYADSVRKDLGTPPPSATKERPARPSAWWQNIKQQGR